MHSEMEGNCLRFSSHFRRASALDRSIERTAVLKLTLKQCSNRGETYAIGTQEKALDFLVRELLDRRIFSVTNYLNKQLFVQ